MAECEAVFVSDGALLRQGDGQPLLTAASFTCGLPLAESTGCCPLPWVISVVDYSAAGSCKGFLERGGWLPAYRLPSPRLQPAALKAADYPLFSPYPAFELQYGLNGNPAPDRGQTLDWPHPDLTEQPE